MCYCGLILLSSPCHALPLTPDSLQLPFVDKATISLSTSVMTLIERLALALENG
jgi:hypothetical protein